MTSPPAASSGLDGAPARVVLLFGWGTGLVHGILMQAFAQDTYLVLAAYALSAGAVAAVTSPPRGTLSLGATVVVIACGAAIATIVLTSTHVTTIVWLFDFASYPIALLIPRGRPIIGGVSLVVFLSAATLWSLTTSQSDPSWGRIISGPLVGGAVGFIWLHTLRGIIARETRARSELERAELHSQAAAAARRIYHRELERVAGESKAILRAIADADELDDALLRHIRVVEGRIRDRLRAADLTHPRVTSCVDAARNLGIDVLLIGDDEAAGQTMSDELANRIVEQLSAPELDTVTIRRLPPGRAATVSVVATSAGRVVRAAFDKDGNRVDAWLDAVTN